MSIWLVFCANNVANNISILHCQLGKKQKVKDIFNSHNEPSRCGNHYSCMLPDDRL